MPDIQPRILDRFIDGFGRLHVIDEEGETILDRDPRLQIIDGKLGIAEDAPDTRGGSTFGVNVDWSGGTAEIRWSSSDDAGNNRSYVWVGLYCHTSGFTTYGYGWFNMRANGDGYTGGNVSIGSSWVNVAARDTWIGHDAAGAQSIEVGVVNGEVQGTSFNNVWGTQWHALTNYVVLPYAPQNARVRAGTVATTSFGVEWTRNTYDTIDQEQAQWATDSGFTNVVWTDTGPGGGNGSGGYSNPAGMGVQLTPGTTHYVRVRSHTSRGWGPYSATVSQTTLPAVPPGLSVASSPSGAQATLTFTPPGGVTGVNPYRWERRLNGTTAPVTTEDVNATVDEVGGLTPGNTYQWRASAFIGSYQSPWTEWVTLQQAKPNTNPGDYFDGSTPDKADLDYGWTGTANASTSVATGQGVEGWAVTTPGGTGAVLYRVTAGIFSAFAARVQITADMTAAGQLRAGQANVAGYRTEVTADATYIGSIHVRPSRGQSLAAELTWVDAAGANVGARVLGAATNVPGETWLRLAVGGVAPAGAVEAVVRAIDVAGTGWSVWLGGEVLDLDGAMISLTEEFPYFDGNTLFDGTYVYEWEGAANASVSTRTPVAQVENQTLVILRDGRAVPESRALNDPDCEIVPAPPRPPIISSDCIEDVGVWRRYYTEIPANLVLDWTDIVPTLEITTGAGPARQVRIRYYPNPEALPPGEVDTTWWLSEQIVSFMPAATVLTLDGVTQRVWAEVNGSDPISADHLLYGTNGRPATWPVLSCGIPYLVSIEVPIAEAAGNVSVAAYLTART